MDIKPDLSGSSNFRESLRRTRSRSSLVDRTLSRMLESAEDGFDLSRSAVDLLSRRGPVQLRRRLATQVVQYGLIKLDERIASMQPRDFPEHWEIVSERLVEPLTHLASATDGLEVLLYGDTVFEVARYFPEFKDVLNVPLRWHDQFAAEIGLRDEGAPPEVPARKPGLIRIDEPVMQVREISNTLLSKLAPRPTALYHPWGYVFAPGRLYTGLTLDRELIVAQEPQRYTDLTLFEEHRYPIDLAEARRVPDDLPLIAGQPYTLEVAIRLKRTGIDAKQNAPPIKNPRQDHESLTVFILAEPSMGIEIPEAFASVKWPYDSDSGSALFRLRANSTKPDLAVNETIQVRLYDHSLDLLDIVDLKVSIAPDDSRQWLLPDMVPMALSWPDQKVESPNIDPKSPPRSLSIDVSFDPAKQSYRLLFKFLRDDPHNPVAIPGSTDMTADDVTELLEEVRDFWTDLVITNYARQLSVTRTTYEAYLKRLRKLGMKAWTKLFGASYADRGGATEAIGKLLSELHLNEGTHIQIVYSHAGNFLFPWSILHRPVPESDAIEPMDFWGARYQIEQVTDGPAKDGLAGEPVNLVFALDRSFNDSPEQERLFQNYQAAAGGKFSVTAPISDKETLFSELLHTPAAHLIYFFCHGYAPAAHGSLLRRDGVQALKDSIASVPEGSPGKTALETLLRLTTKMDREAWMYIGDAEIKETDLALKDFFAPNRRPIVFLNMCQSAGLLPSMSSGLVRVFLEKNASAVVGTESPMTAVFAHAFAEQFFNSLFGGDDVGTALWKSRRHFLQNMRNPLGLGYTLYGRATAKVGSSAIVPATTTSKQGPVESGA
jgi:hypothetical protein